MHPMAVADNPVNITTRVTGIASARHLLQSLPGTIPSTVEATLTDIVELGIDLMGINVMNSIRTEKSRGVLAESIQGDFWKTHGQPGSVAGAWEAEIGSALPYAGFASREIGLSTINRNVLLQTGKWVWIGIRPPIPGHPFLEQTLLDLNKALPTMLNGHFQRYMGEVQREVDEMERST